MTFTKVVKNKAYFKRYQVKYRRRREGKTDYYARKRLVTQAKNKYMSPKHRLVVRVTNRTIICQIVAAEIVGDKVLCSAYSSELPRYGLTVGLKNYAAAYCTGLLCARRLLTARRISNRDEKSLAELYKGDEEVSGEIPSATSFAGRKYTVQSDQLDEEIRPFKALLDVGVRATTRGSRIWAALKGASDGGLDIPHNPKNFPGYDVESKSYDASAHRARIFGAHVAEYMSSMEENDPEDYAEHFKKYIAAGVTADSLEDLYESVHAKIREDPARKPKDKSRKFDEAGAFRRKAKRGLKQRKNRIKQKQLARIMALQRMAAADEDSD